MQQKFLKNNSSSKQEGDSVSENSRALLTEDELASIGDKAIIALVKDSRPIICHKAIYYNDPVWVGQWDNNPVENRG